MQRRMRGQAAGGGGGGGGGRVGVEGGRTWRGSGGGREGIQ